MNTISTNGKHFDNLDVLYDSFVTLDIVSELDNELQVVLAKQMDDELQDKIEQVVHLMGGNSTLLRLNS